jgi:hypothetical protein
MRVPQMTDQIPRCSLGARSSSDGPNKGERSSRLESPPKCQRCPIVLRIHWVLPILHQRLLKDSATTVMNRHDLQEKQPETTAAPRFEPIFCPRRPESRASKAHIRSSHGLHKPFLPDEDSRHRHQRLNAPKQWINNTSTKHNKKYRVC